MRQASDNHEQHADGDNRCAAETREGILRIEHTRDVEHANGPEEHQVTAPLGKQQNSKHAQHRHNGDPGVNTKT